MCLNAESVGKKNDALANLSPDEVHWIPEASKCNFRCSTFTITLYQEFILQPVEMEREGLTAQLLSVAAETIFSLTLLAACLD